MSSPSSRRMDNVNWRLWTYLLAIPILLFYVLSLTGCVSSSPGLPNIFLMELQSMNSTAAATSNFHVRAGYFGSCPNPTEDSWQDESSQQGPGICAGTSKDLACYTTTGTSATSLTSRFNGSNTASFDVSTVEHLLSLTIFLQSRVFVPLLAAAGALFLIGVFFLTLLKRHLKSTANHNAANRRQIFRRATNLCLWASTAFALSSAFAVGQTASALQYTTASTQSSIRIMSGTTLQILQWLTFAFSVTFAFGISNIFQSSSNAGQTSTGATSKNNFGGVPLP